MKTFYITTPIYYPNGAPHMGHAYTTTLADILARYHRLIGDETYFLTGTDENSEKVVQAAKKVGKKPREFLDEIIAQYKKLFGELDFSFNQFIRTSDEERHWPGAEALWKRLVKSGDIYKGAYEGLYCIGCESFVTEKDLTDGKCPHHNAAPEKLKEENYFFKLSKYTSTVRESIENGEFVILPDARKNEILALLDEGLQDISFSRPKKAVPWGIPVPDDPTQVIYVWCDALANYLSALGFGTKDDTMFKRFWPADVHVMAKEILRFHAAIWPAMLLSAGLPLPKAVFVHGFIVSGGKKMSKTLGNVLDPRKFVEEYGAEAVRYYLARHINPFEDSDMSEESFRDAYNAHLANGLGNIAARVLGMVEQYEVDLGELVFESPEDIARGEEADDWREALERFEVSRAADVVWSLLAFMDSYIQDEAPFKTIEDDEEKAHRDILFMVEKLWEVAALATPFLPETSEKIQKAIKAGKAPPVLFPRK